LRRFWHLEVAEDLCATSHRDPNLAGACLGRRGIAGRTGQQLGDLGVLRRLEVPIPSTDRPQEIGLEHADDVVGLLAQRLHDLRGAHRHGEHEAARVTRTHRAQRRAGRPAGGQSVVDDDRGAPVHLERRPAAPIALHAGIDLRPRTRDRGVELLDAHQHPSHRLLIEHLHAALRDRTNPVLGITWGTDLSHHEHVERRSERLCDLVGDRNAPAR